LIKALISAGDAKNTNARSPIIKSEEGERGNEIKKEFNTCHRSRKGRAI